MSRRKCFIPGCKTGYRSYNSKFTLYKAPSEYIAKWGGVVNRPGRPFSTKDVICERHFEEIDIVRVKGNQDVSTNI